jgi:Mg2+ and Co2+ transporter CorA
MTFLGDHIHKDLATRLEDHADGIDRIEDEALENDLRDAAKELRECRTPLVVRLAVAINKALTIPMDAEAQAILRRLVGERSQS